MNAFYNENDPFAAQWLRNLIAAGEIAPGIVDERSVHDLRPDDLEGFAQVHLFAGIGVWSRALRDAGWPDDRPVWTGSCPCQPFSAAGRGEGFDDARHLWPHFARLVRARRPVVVLGEQVASKDGLMWLDAVFADLEGEGYACGAVDTCAAGHGAPHIRQRLWWVGLADASPRGRAQGRGPHGGPERAGDGPADDGLMVGLGDADDTGLEGHHRHGHDGGQPGWLGAQPARPVAAPGGSGGLADADGSRPLDDEQPEDGRQAAAVAECRSAGGLADADEGERGGLRGHDRSRREGSGAPELDDPARHHGAGGRLADAGRDRDRQHPGELRRDEGQHEERPAHGVHPSLAGSATGLLADAGRPGPADGLWGAADWLLCRDGRWRPVEPGTFPLAHGTAGRLGYLCPACVRDDDAETVETPQGAVCERCGRTGHLVPVDFGSNRVGRLRGYGNAIVLPQATAFAAAILDITGGSDA